MQKTEWLNLKVIKIIVAVFGLAQQVEIFPACRQSEPGIADVPPGFSR
jgi:hypothetical protein